MSSTIKSNKTKKELDKKLSGKIRLYRAVKINNIDNLKKLLDENPHIDVTMTNKDNVNILMIACERGYIEIVKYLLEKYSDIIKKFNINNIYNGANLLMCACMSNNIEIVKLITDNFKFNINYNDIYRHNVLYYIKRYDILEYLLIKYVDLKNLINNRDSNLLFYMIDRIQYYNNDVDKLIELLIEYGLNIYAIKLNKYPINELFSYNCTNASDEQYSKIIKILTYNKKYRFVNEYNIKYIVLRFPNISCDDIQNIYNCISDEKDSMEYKLALENYMMIMLNELCVKKNVNLDIIKYVKSKINIDKFLNSIKNRGITFDSTIMDELNSIESNMKSASKRC